MKFFFTDSCELSESLAAAGYEIVNGPGTYWSDFVDFEDEDHDPRDYPIKRLIRDSKADILVAVEHVKIVDGVSSGLAKGPLLSWVGLIRGRRLVAYDPAGKSWRISRERQPRGCTARIHNYNVYITSDEEAAVSVCQLKRTVMWSPGQDTGAVIKQIERGGSAYPERQHGQQPYRSEER